MNQGSAKRILTLGENKIRGSTISKLMVLAGDSFPAKKKARDG
jgi:hypothetical protein